MQQATIGNTVRPGQTLYTRTKARKVSSVNRFEAVLLMAMIIFQPLEDEFIIIQGRSFMFLLIAFITAYAFTVRLHRFPPLLHFWSTWTYIIFIGMALLVESMMLGYGLGGPFRLGMSLLGSLAMAMLITNTSMLRLAVLAFWLRGIWLALLYFINSYGLAAEASVATFHQAEIVRENVMHAMGVRINLNVAAFVMLISVVLGILHLTRVRSSRFLRVANIVISGILLLSIALTMSRTAMAGLFVSVFYLVATETRMKANRVRILGVLAVLGVIFSFLIPEAAWLRISSGVEEGAFDSRRGLYEIALIYLPEYFASGIGYEGFFGEWGQNSLFAYGDRVRGTHNGFLQVMIYWGIVPALVHLFFWLRIYLDIRKYKNRDEFYTISIFFVMMASLFLLTKSEVFSKQLTLLMGFLFGYLNVKYLETRSRDTALRNQRRAEVASRKVIPARR